MNTATIEWHLVIPIGLMVIGFLWACAVVAIDITSKRRAAREESARKSMARRARSVERQALR